MSTSISQEYKVAQKIIEGFRSNETPIIVNGVYYYYDRIPIQKDRIKGIEYKVLLEEERQKFNIEHLKKQADEYYQKVPSNFPNN